MNEASSNIIKSAREKRGLTQIELANQAQCDQASISRYENGRGRPNFAVAKRLAKILKFRCACAIMELLTDEEDPPQKRTKHSHH